MDKEQQPFARGTNVMLSVIAALHNLRDDGLVAIDLDSSRLRFLPMGDAHGILLRLSGFRPTEPEAEGVLKFLIGSVAGFDKISWLVKQYVCHDRREKAQEWMQGQPTKP